jgi:hypothetical protein
MRDCIERHRCERAASVPRLRTVGEAAAAGRGHRRPRRARPAGAGGQRDRPERDPAGRDARGRAMTAGPSGGLAIETPGVDVALGGVEVLHGIGMALAAGAGGTTRRLSRCGSAVRRWPRCPAGNGRGQLSWLDRVRSD